MGSYEKGEKMKNNPFLKNELQTIIKQSLSKQYTKPEIFAQMESCVDKIVDEDSIPRELKIGTIETIDGIKKLMNLGFFPPTIKKEKIKTAVDICLKMYELEKEDIKNKEMFKLLGDIAKRCMEGNHKFR